MVGTATAAMTAATSEETTMTGTVTTTARIRSGGQARSPMKTTSPTSTARIPTPGTSTRSSPIFNGRSWATVAGGDRWSS